MTGLSFSSITNFFKDLFTERTKASAETNSEYNQSAPYRLQNFRKGGFVTSSIGARIKGCSPTSTPAIFIQLFLNLNVFRLLANSLFLQQKYTLLHN